jgi:drug/metabolite transporter (DMT)-like permease
MPAFLVPLAAAFLFPVAALALKRAMEKTKDPWGILWVTNIATALAFLPLFAWPGKPFASGLGYQPLICGALFFLAQIAAYKSFAGGDLSVAIPAQGTKVLIVAALTVRLLKTHLSPWLWAAAFLTVAAIYLLQDRRHGLSERARLRSTLAYALLAAAAFALLDVLVQKWSPAWGPQRFGPWIFLCQAVLSFLLLLFPGRHLEYSARSWVWLALGAFIMALITLALVIIIGLEGQAALVNILFNSRAIWSVLLVWLAGRRFGNRETNAGRPAMAHRLAGAVLMMAAIVMATLG